MNFEFAHNNINVLDLDKSLKFYHDALGLKVTREYKTDNFTLVYLGDDKTSHLLELTWLKNRTEPYNLGDNEIHIAFRTNDYDGAYKKHKEMDVICYDNPTMGIYFIADPDGYWLEIIPEKM